MARNWPEPSERTVRRHHGYVPEPKTLSRLIRGDLDWIVMKALEKDRTRRYASPSDLAADVRYHLTHQPVVARPPGAAFRVKKFVVRNRLRVVFGCVVVASILVLAIHANRITHEREATRQARVRTDVRKLMLWLAQNPESDVDGNHARPYNEILKSVCERIRRGTASDLDHRAFVRSSLIVNFQGRNLVDEADEANITLWLARPKRRIDGIRRIGMLIQPHILLDGQPITLDGWREGILVHRHGGGMGDTFLKGVRLGGHRLDGFVRVQIVEMLREQSNVSWDNPVAGQDYRPFAGAFVDTPIATHSFTVVETYPHDYPPMIVNEQVARDFNDGFVLERIALHSAHDEGNGKDSSAGPPRHSVRVGEPERSSLYLSMLFRSRR